MKTTVEQKVNKVIMDLNEEGARLIREKISLTSSAEYLAKKQEELDEECDRFNEPRRQYKIKRFEFLHVMTEDELKLTVSTTLPILPLEEKIANDRCKYMIGTLPNTLLIKGTGAMLRVGGGFAKLE